MSKRRILALFFTVLLTGTVFAKKHESGNVLAGINLGLGVTPNITKVTKSGIPEGNYAAIGDIGVTFDYYPFSWLSISSGLFIHQGLYQLLDHDLDFNNADKFKSSLVSPMCLTVPFSIHINFPFAEWLYAGAGLNLNFPVLGVTKSDLPGFDTKGVFFTGIPIDIGFDFIRQGKGGSRLFFRITPEFHKKGTVMPIGFIWQIYNIKVR